jgi:DNA-binding FadR family transcriptional regulator
MRDWRMIDEDVVSWRFRAKPDPQFMRDVIEFRMLIEPRATAQAAVRASAVEVAGIREAFEAFKVLQPGEPGYDAADELLHTRIVHASGNQFFLQMAAIVRGAVRLVNPRVALKEGAHEVAVKAHARVVEAIERRYPREAEAASLALIDYSVDEISRDFSVDAPVRA